MKPIIFYDFEKDEKFPGSVIINQETFEKLLDQVYQAGVEDGKRDKVCNSFYATRDAVDPAMTTKKSLTYEDAVKTYLTNQIKERE